MILVTGATGNVGRLVVDHLLARGVRDVRALTVNPAKAALPAGVEVVQGYLGRPESLAPALEGVDRMYLAPLPQTVREVCARAAAAGVRQIVDLAGPKDSWWGVVEEAVEDSGVPWTHLEAGEFMINSLRMWAGQIRTTGAVRDAHPDAADAPIDLGDIAAVAAAALVEDGHVGRAYELTGPESLTRAERVRLIGAAIGREIPYVEVSPAEAVALLSPEMGGDAGWYVEWNALLVRHPQPAVATVAEVTGRPGTTFAAWARTNAAHFR